MPTQTHGQDPSRPYGEPAGIRLTTALEGVGADPFTVAQAVHEGVALGLSSRHAVDLLHRLAASGWLTRIKKGVYAINDPVTKMPKAHVFAIGTALVAPSTVSHWSALQYWGLTEQIPATVTVSSPIRTFPPPDEAGGAGGRPAWLVAGVRYEVITITKARFFGVTHVWASERNQITIFDRERALLDTFHHFHVFGSLSVALEMLETHLPEIDIARLVQYAQQLGVGAVMKRVGWAMDRLAVPPDVLGPLQTYRAKGDAPLDPGRPARGRHNRTWRVIENL